MEALQLSKTKQEVCPLNGDLTEYIACCRTRAQVFVGAACGDEFQATGCWWHWIESINRVQCTLVSQTTPTGWWQQRNCWEPSLDRCRLRRSCYNFGGQQILAGVVLLQERVDLVLQRLQEQAYGSNIFLQKAFFMLRSTKRLGTIILRRWHQVTSTGLPRRPYLICEYIHKLRQIINDNKYPFISI